MTLGKIITRKEKVDTLKKHFEFIDTDSMSEKELDAWFNFHRFMNRCD